MAQGDVGVRPVADGGTTNEALPSILQAVVASAMDAIVALDAEQRIVLFNAAAGTMFRCPAQQALGQPLDRFLPPQYRAVHGRHVAAFGTTGDTARSMGHLRPLKALRADGEEFAIEATITRVLIDGQPYSAAIVREITARLEAEAALRRQANLLDLAYDAIFTWEWDGAITSWNRGAEQLYGYLFKEAIGQPSHDLLRTRHPDGPQMMLATLERDRVWEGELSHTRRDGTEVIVESRHVLVNEGHTRYVLEVTRDITARRRGEAERATSVERETTARAEAEAAAASRDALQLMLDALPGGVLIMVAPDAHIAFANDVLAELVFGSPGGANATPVYGQDFRFMRFDGTPLPVGDRPGVRALRGEHVQNLQLVLQRNDGQTVPVAVHAAPLLGTGRSGSASALVFVQDVTPLRQAEQLKDDFLALVSHELRTPLTTIHGGARILRSKPDLDPATRAELLDDVVAESERLERLLSNLLTLTDITAGRLRASLEPVLIESLIKRVAEEIGRRSSAHTFLIEGDPRLPPAEADPYFFEEVLRNLYENAVKYSPAGGTIRTTLESDQGMIVLRVTDEGMGIAPEDVAVVFERFRRVGSCATVRGMGLGLYLCRGLVEAQGGSIAASSPGPGQGATFTVRLPFAWE